VNGRNRALERLGADQPAFGAWALSASPRVAEVLSTSGLDWVGIDAEHGPIGPAEVETLVRAVERGDAAPLVRLPSVAAAVDGGCQHALDSSAAGVIVPGVETAAGAAEVVRVARFPPDGERGVAGTVRSNDYGARFDEHAARANDELLVVVQIESPAGVDDADEILGVDGVDVAFVGENDLSAAHGHPGAADHEAVRAGVTAVLEAALDRGVHPGIAGRTPEATARRLDRGFRFFLLGADVTFVRDGIEGFLDGVDDAGD
jgi:2-dehydro-3-deoxyglucarate aldolase/4-hydroxy-2-oxoheptanedioate aldolase